MEAISVSTPCRGITCAEAISLMMDICILVSTPCRGITCAELVMGGQLMRPLFPPPVGESPVLRAPPLSFTCT